MFNLVAGLALIGVGVAMGASIFRGNFNVFFDGLGVFWIGKGLYHLYKELTKP